MQPGDVIAERFELCEVAGTGGMGVVYRARDRATGEVVALKILREMAELEGERFAREGRVLAELSHPAIVRYVAHGTAAGGARYLAMEWLDGEHLGARLARAGLSVRESVALATRTASALGAAHARGVVHRDVTPRNLFLVGGDPARVRVLDFGIARLIDAGPQSTQSGTLIGTPGYMAPEQARGEPDVDARVDVFALGCVLFECLTGRAAFAGEHVMAILAKVLLHEPPHPRELRPDVPPALADLVLRMLAKDRDQRPRDGAALAAELAALGPLDERASAPAPARSPTLTTGEQRLLSIVLAGRPAPSGEQPTALLVDASGQGRALENALRAAARGTGAHLERMADGSTVLTLSGTGTATDLVVQAARSALAVRALLPDAPIALTTGRGQVSGRWPVGEAIDRAVRMVRAEPRGSAGVRIDDVSAGLLDARFDVRAEGAVVRLLGERGAAEVTRTLLGRPTPCVGRDRELATLTAFADECFTEPVARAVLLTAAPGVGKTRVAREFLARLTRREDPPEVWIARGDPMSAGSSFAMLGQAIRRAAGMLDGEPLSTWQAKLRARVARGVPAGEVARVAEFLGELVGARVGADEGSVQLRAARRDAVLMGDQMRRAWEDFITGECAGGPLVLILEELHWGDLPTVTFIDAALRRVGDRPWLVVGVGRPEVHDAFPRLWTERGVQEIRLGELTRKACEKLVRHALDERATDAVVARLVEQSSGNALYLEELIRAVAEGRGDALPETVLAMVQARLEELEPEARRVLRAASVFGASAWERGVGALLGGEARGAQAQEWLDELSKREVLERRPRSRFADEREYGFRSAVAREASYAMLTDADRALGHRLAAEWLEAAGERDALALAEHWERAGEPSRAVGFFRRSAEQARDANDFDALVRRAERGVQCGAAGEARGALRLLQAEAHRWRGEHADAEACGRDALELFPHRGVAWYGAAAEVAIACGRGGHHERLAALGEALLAADHEATSETAGPYVVAAARTAVQLLHAGRLELGHALIERLGHVAAAHADVVQGDPAVAARIHEAGAVEAVCTGDPGACLVLAGRAAEEFRAAGDLRNECNQRINAGFASVETGLYDEAERDLREALAAAERMGLRNVVAVAKHNLGLALARRGALDEARRCEAEAAEALARQGDRRLESAARIYLATILVLAGELSAADVEAERAIVAASASPPFRCYALAMRAQVRLACGRASEALSDALEGAELLRELGAVEDGEALVRLMRAEALHAAGRRDEAHEAIASARERLLERASRISDPALRERFLGAVPDNVRTLRLAQDWAAAPGA